MRPIFNRLAISDLLTPARCSFRISAAWAAAVAGCPNFCERYVHYRGTGFYEVAADLFLGGITRQEAAH